MFDLVLKEGSVFDGYHSWVGDIAITHGVISALGSCLAGKREIDVSGKWIFPGAIDAHTHMSLPFAGAVSADDFFTGTRAAAFGGVTTIIDFLSQKGDEGLRSSFERRFAQADGKAVVDYSFHNCIGRFSSEVEADLDWALEKGLTSMKVFTAYRKSGLMMTDDQLFRTFRHLGVKGILPTVHAENGDIIEILTQELVDRGQVGIGFFSASRPVFSETEAVRRVIDLATAAGAPVYIVHVSAGDSAELIRSSRLAGARVFAETCPQYLLLDETRFSGEEGHRFSCCPPLRPSAQQEGLWRGLEQGHIQVVGTDHCPFNTQAKDSWGGDFTRLPMGLPGVETLMPLMIHRGLERGWPLNSLVRTFSAEPAKIFGLYPRKGAILPGSDADLVVFDPRKKVSISRFSLHMNLDYSIYDGMDVVGWPVVTVSRGEILVENGFFTGREGHGKIVPRTRSSAFPR